jgi:hypothetical protein
MPEILSTINRKARKDHKCSFCGLKIKKGTEYQYQGIVGDGHVYTWKSHLRCIELCNKLEMFDHCDDGVTDNDFAEYVNEEYHNILRDDNIETGTRIFQERLEIVCKKYLI